MNRSCLAALSLALLAAGLGACETREPAPLVFRYHLSAAPTTLDPARGEDAYSAGVIDRLFDGLMRLDRVGNVPEPELAQSYAVSDDGLVYEFHLHPGARFHNGREIRAADVKYSWQRVLAPQTGSPRAWLFELVAGAGAFRAGKADAVAGIEAPSPAVVRVRLREPFAPFLYHLTDFAASIVPREEVERLGEGFGRRPIGSGPFRFVAWEDDARVELAATGDGRRPRPQVDRLIYQAIPDGQEALQRYQDGQLDLVSWLPSGSLTALQQSYSSDLRIFPGAYWFGFCMRCDQPPFDDPRVRRALALAVDRNALVRELGEAQYTAIVGFLPQAVPGHDPATLNDGYDPDRARALLAAAGFPGGAGFPRQVYATRTGELDAKVAQSLSAAFAELGLVVGSDAMAFSALVEAWRERSVSLFRLGASGEYPDPEPYLRSLFHSQGQSNHMAYDNAETDRLLDAAHAESDASRRRELYREAEKLIIRDAPCVGLYQLTEAILLHPRWTDIPIGFDGAYLEIERARLAEGLP